jgi:hypothetical protein
MSIKITAADDGDPLTLAVYGTVTASVPSRSLSGEVVRYGVYGRTSRGRLKVRPGALRFPDDLTRVKLTKEHKRDESRGFLTQLDRTERGIRVTARVADGPEGDAALREADPSNPIRDGFSFDVIDAVIEGDEIVDAVVIAVGQVGIPAYDDMRIDTVAASQTQQGNPTEGTTQMLTDQQRARLTELRGKERAALTADEATELDQLTNLAGDAADQPPADQQPPAAQTPAPAGVPVAASIPGIPAGSHYSPARTQAVDPLADFVRTIVEGYGGNGTPADPSSITAALADVTYSAHSGNVAVPGWSGELWSGLAYEPEFTPLLASGDLTAIKGKGWRWVTKPELADYAGDKAAIPTNTPDTEPSEYTAARLAAGHDLDRAFYDFPDEAFLRSYVEAMRESWAMKLDGKVETYINTSAVAATIGGVAVPAQTSMLGAAAKALRALKRNRVGRGSFVIFSDDDYDTLMDFTNDTVPAFLELFDLDPKGFTSSSLVADGTVIAGVKQASTVRTLPGSPIRATAQHLANGGIDEAFFGYYAIEEHHSTGIVKVTWV